MSKNQNDKCVTERRLRPIYEWLDINNNKKAIQEADRVLKKSPDLVCAKVLKSLALIRLGKEQEGEALLDAIRLKCVYDESSLQAMAICYRDLHKPDQIYEVYEEAVKKDPTNEELQTHLFMSYVRVYNYKKQQQVAMSLYKQQGKNPYYFWAVMSIVMQASDNNSISKSVTLPLAERMIKKFIDEDRIDAEQEVHLYIIVLEMQEKYKECLEVLEGPLGLMLQSFYTAPQKRIELYIALENWEKVNLMLKSVLLESDSWDNYVNYFNSVFKLVPKYKENKTTLELAGSSKKPEDEEIVHQVDLNFEKCYEFLSFLEKKNEKLPRKLRGPYLGLMEFYVRLNQVNKENGETPEIKNNNVDWKSNTGLAHTIVKKTLLELLLEYYKMFGANPSCLKDLMPYLEHLSAEELNIFLHEQWIMNGIEAKEDFLPSDKTSILKFLSCLQFNRYIGKYNNENMSVEDKINLIKKLTTAYFHCDKYTTTQLPTELKVNDSFIQLIVYLLHDLHLTHHNFVKYILLYVHHVTQRNHYNFNLELLALKYYDSIGASGAGHFCYNRLDMKHIQLDSLGYLHCGPLLSNAQYYLATSVFDNTLKFFTTNYKDNADHLALSYKFGSFLKIDEFYKFRQRLNNSLHYTLSTIEKMLMDILFVSSYSESINAVSTMYIDPSVDNILWDDLEDNRDIYVYNTCNPNRMRPNENYKKITYKNDVYLLKLRSLVIRCLVASINIAHPSKYYQEKDTSKQNGTPVTDTVTKADALKRVINEIEGFQGKLTQEPPQKLPEEVLCGIPLQRIFLYQDHQFLTHFTLISSAVHDLTTNDIDAFELHMDLGINLLKKEFECLKEKFIKFKSNISYENNQILIQTMAIFLEIISILNIKCGVISNIIKNNPILLSKAGDKNKKKKKHKGNQQQNDITESSSPNNSLDANDSTTKNNIKNPKDILNKMIEKAQEINTEFLNIINECESDLEDKFIEHNKLKSNSSLHPSEETLIEYLTTLDKQFNDEDNDLINEIKRGIDNIKMNGTIETKVKEAKNKSESKISTVDDNKISRKGKNKKSDKSKSDDKIEDDNKISGEMKLATHDNKNKSKLYNHCLNEVNENIKNSYKVSCTRIRNIATFKCFNF